MDEKENFKECFPTMCNDLFVDIVMIFASFDLTNDICFPIHNLIQSSRQDEQQVEEDLFVYTHAIRKTSSGKIKKRKKSSQGRDSR